MTPAKVSKVKADKMNKHSKPRKVCIVGKDLQSKRERIMSLVSLKSYGASAHGCNKNTGKGSKM